MQFSGMQMQLHSDIYKHHFKNELFIVHAFVTCSDSY